MLWREFEKFKMRLKKIQKLKKKVLHWLFVCFLENLCIPRYYEDCLMSRIGKSCL